MILLNDSVIASHPIFSHVKTPPTHAKIIGRKGPTTITGSFMHDSLNGSWAENLIEALYAFGTVEDGIFVPSTIPSTAVHTVVDNTEYDSTAEDSLLAKMSARNHLRNAGVSPDPNDPTKAKSTPSKKQDDFKNCDLDAYFSIADQRLLGTVVPD